MLPPIRPLLLELAIGALITGTMTGRSVDQVRVETAGTASATDSDREFAAEQHGRDADSVPMRSKVPGRGST